MSLYRFTAIGAALLLLAGCGFQMRGAATLPADMAQTYIETNDRYTLFYRELRSGLRDAGVEVVDRATDSAATFTIHSDETGQRVLSVSARNVPREFEVYYSVYYDVATADKVLLEPRMQTMTSDYIWDETLVLGKEKEEQVLREALVDNLIRVILIQLSSL